jgi:hypothetical protein
MDAHPDPFRNLAWRYERARALHEQQRRAARQDDVWVRRALSWLRSPARRAPWHSSIKAAHALYEEDALPRWRLEGWVLTGLPQSEVAARCSLPAECVEAYEQVFFDVRSGLTARSWLNHRTLPPRSWLYGFRRGDTASLLKWAALTGGPLILEQVQRVLTTPRRTTPLRTVDELEEALCDLSCRFALLLHTLPLRAFLPPTREVILQVSQALLDLQRHVDAAGQANPLEQVRREVQEQMLPPLAVGQASPPPVDEVVVRLGQLDDIVDRLGHLQFARAA